MQWVKSIIVVVFTCLAVNFWTSAADNVGNLERISFAFNYGRISEYFKATCICLCNNANADTFHERELSEIEGILKKTDHTDTP